MPHTTYGLVKAIRSHEISSPNVRESVTARRPNACNLCHLDKTLEWTNSHMHDWYGTDRLQADQGSAKPFRPESTGYWLVTPASARLRHGTQVGDQRSKHRATIGWPRFLPSCSTTTTRWCGASRARRFANCQEWSKSNTTTPDRGPINRRRQIESAIFGTPGKRLRPTVRVAHCF